MRYTWAGLSSDSPWPNDLKNVPWDDLGLETIERGLDLCSASLTAVEDATLMSFEFSRGFSKKNKVNKFPEMFLRKLKKD